MSAGPLEIILRHLRRRTDPGGGLTDAELIERFVAARDEAAFEVLLWRHGPMVLGVCRRLLRREEDREDAFQATFLALAHKAGSIGKRHAVGSWLYKVAYRVALDARACAARSAAHERSVSNLPTVESPQEDIPGQVARRELESLLDAEIHRLPRKYREAIILCHLEGKTQEEAARELGWAKGTVSTRLIRARELLRRRLLRHGEAFGTTAMLQPLVKLTPPPSLVQPTLRAALAVGVPAAAVPLASAKSLALAEGVLRAMSMNQWKLAVVLVLTAFLGAGAGWLSYVAARAAPEAGEYDPEPPRAPQAGTARTAPLARLDPNHIPPENRFDGQPAELTAVLGDQRGRHWSDVTGVAYSPDGRLIASCGHDFAVRLWDATTLQERAVLKQHTQAVSCVAFSPDGKTLASRSSDKTLVLWDLTATPPRARAVLEPPDWARALAFSPDGVTLACGGSEVHLWKVAGEKPPEELPPLRGPQKSVDAVAFSLDGKALASAGDDAVVLWDLTARTPQAVLPTNAQTVRSVAFAPDGKTLAVSCETWGAVMTYSVILWDLTDPARPREKAVLKKHTHHIFAVKFSPDSRTLATTGWDGTVRLWDLTGHAPAEKHVIQTRSSVQSLDFAPDGKTLVTGDRDCMVRLWDLTGAAPTERVLRKGHTDGVTGLALARTGLAASGGRDGIVRLWDLSGPQPEERHALAGTRNIALSRDGATLAIGTRDGTLEVWDLGKERPRKRGEVPAHKVEQVSGVGAVEVSPDGKVLVSCGYDNVVRLWDLTRDKPQELRHFKGHASNCRLAFSRDGVVTAAANYGQNLNRPDPGVFQAFPTVRVWDLTGAKPQEVAALEHATNAYCAAFSPDGRILATGGGDGNASGTQRTPGEVRLWRLDEGGRDKRAQLLEGHAATVYDVAFSPDGQVLASVGCNGQVILWELATGTKYRAWQMPGPVYRVTFADDGRHLVTANANGTLYVLRLGQGAKALADGPALWEALASPDAADAYPAVWSLAPPQRTPALFHDRLRPVEAVDAAHVRRLIDQLDADPFAEREKARAALEELRERAAPALRRRLAEGPLSAESRRRIEQILEPRPVPAAQLRSLRAIQVLERLADGDARRLLERLAGGAPEARETQQAQAALKRAAARP